jgi:hypothetical protein
MSLSNYQIQSHSVTCTLTAFPSKPTLASQSDMEANVPPSKSLPQGPTTGPSENAGPTPIIGKPGDVNGPATIPHLERGVNGYGAGGTSSLPLQGQPPA